MHQSHDHPLVPQVRLACPPSYPVTDCGHNVFPADIVLISAGAVASANVLHSYVAEDSEDIACNELEG